MQSPSRDGRAYHMRMCGRDRPFYLHKYNSRAGRRCCLRNRTYWICATDCRRLRRIRRAELHALSNRNRKPVPDSRPRRSRSVQPTFHRPASRRYVRLRPPSMPADLRSPALFASLRDIRHTYACK